VERTQQNNPSNPDIFEGRWKQMRGELRSWWGRLTDDDLEQIGGQQERLLGRLQERYGYTRERAQQEVERRLQEYHARGGPASPSGRTPPIGASAPKIGSSPAAKEQTAQPSSAASSPAHQATAAVGEQLGSLADVIRDKAPHEGTAGRAASAVAEKLGAAGSYLQETKDEHVAGDVTELIRRYPMAALLMAFGIGYVVARSTRR
jgi:uncharacterized protein YjbJ (UPF0337 family)